MNREQEGGTNRGSDISILTEVPMLITPLYEDHASGTMKENQSTVRATSDNSIEDNRTHCANRRHYTSMLSSDARASAIERGILGLYRRYTLQSLQRRNWHADTCVDWKALGANHSDAVHTVVEGFFAVEQYTPDYVAPLIIRLRQSYGRSQWHIRWGAEEQRHADLWRNTVVALGRRDEAWIDKYTASLRQRDWRLPWESPLHMVFYQVIQERATQVSYLNLAQAVLGKLQRLETPFDATLGQVCHLIAADEAAHYHFFVEVARLLLYYEPQKAIPAFLEVLRRFSMPARDIIDDYDTFGKTLHESGIFGRTIYYREVVQTALDALTISSIREAEHALSRASDVTSTDQELSTLLDIVNLPVLEQNVRHLFLRNQNHLEKTGLAHLFASPWQPAWHIENPS